MKAIAKEIALQTHIELRQSELEALDRLAEREKISRTDLIERAVRDLLHKNDQKNKTEAFGLWGDRKVDGLEFQQKIRGEW